jgi:hypothetical protein
MHLGLQGVGREGLLKKQERGTEEGGKKSGGGDMLQRRMSRRIKAAWQQLIASKSKHACVMVCLVHMLLMFLYTDCSRPSAHMPR